METSVQADHSFGRLSQLIIPLCKYFDQWQKLEMQHPAGTSDGYDICEGFRIFDWGFMMVV